MQLDIYPSEHHVTLEGTAEIILTRRVIALEYGEENLLTHKLSALVREAIKGEDKASATFCHDETRFILEALHNLAISRSDCWGQAQATHMLRAVT